MQLKLTQSGYENFTGVMGSIDFVDGVSSQDVSAHQAGGILNVIQGELVGNAQSLEVLQPVPQPAPEPQPVVEPEPQPVAEPEAPVEPVAEPSPAE